MSKRINTGRAVCLVAVYFTAALLGGWFLKSHSFSVVFLGKLSFPALLVLNASFILFGIPLSALGDLLLLKKAGLAYLFYWPFFVALASCAQIYFFRSFAGQPWFSPLFDQFQRHSKEILPGDKRQALFILLIRTVPLLPFLLGSFVISLIPGVRRKAIVGYSILGCYLYYAYFGAGFLVGSHALGS